MVQDNCDNEELEKKRAQLTDHSLQCSSRSSSLVQIAVKWLQDEFYSIVCFCTVPMWTMLMHMSLFIAMVRYAPTDWLRLILLLYVPYCFLDNSPQTGKGWGKRLSPSMLEWLRHNPSFHATARYFPITLHKTVELDAAKPYIFCYHPHGVISMGACTALNTNGCNFDQVFPGIRRFGVTLNICFCIPIFREWILALGFVSANRTSMARELQAGNSLVLIPGGSIEALLSHPDQMSMMARRQGFVRLALECNAPLIPCLGFGENRTFSTYIPTEDAKHSRWLHWWQRWWCQWTTVSVPILTSMWPRTTPVVVVVGAPVPLKPAPQSDNQDDEVEDVVVDLHIRYWKAVQDLYDEHKERYGYQDIPLKLL